MSNDDLVATPGGGPELEAAYTEIRGLMEQRNLTLAADRCGRLLQDYPDEPTAHALMGDIFAARQLWPEAVQWYTQAEDAGGGPEVARRRAAAAAMAPRSAAAPEAPSGLPDLHRQRTRILAIFGAAVAIALLAVVIALLAWPGRGPGATGRTARAPKPSAPGAGLPTPQRAPARSAGGGLAVLPPATAPPVATAPKPPAPGGRAATPARTAPPSARPPVVISRHMDVPATDEDYIIAKAVSTLTWPEGTSMSGDVSVMMDPYQAYCVVSFRIPETVGGGNLRDIVVAQAYKVILAALESDAAISAVTVRAIASITTAHRERTALQAFRANLSREAAENWHKTIPNPTPQQLREQILAFAWWNPAIPTDRLR